MKYYDEASALYDGGWRAEDRDGLIKQYALTAEAADGICELLAAMDTKHIYTVEHISRINAGSDGSTCEVYPTEAAADKAVSLCWDCLTANERKKYGNVFAVKEYSAPKDLDMKQAYRWLCDNGKFDSDTFTDIQIILCDINA